MACAAMNTARNEPTNTTIDGGPSATPMLTPSRAPASLNIELKAVANASDRAPAPRPAIEPRIALSAVAPTAMAVPSIAEVTTPEKPFTSSPA